MLVNNLHSMEINSPVRQLKGKVELYEGSTLLNSFLYTDRLKSFEIDRAGVGKFFGYGVSQKANIKLIDKNIELNITTSNSFKLYLGADDDYITSYPTFYVTEVNRDENTGELSITAYDKLKDSSEITVADIPIAEQYVIDDYVRECAALLGLSYEWIGVDGEQGIYYESGANLEGSETIKEVLDAIAEVTQAIYYINAAGALVFKRLDRDGEAAAALTRDNYFTLDSKTNRRLSTIASITELGDNVTASLDAIGTTQYIKDNPFIELREDAAAILTNALDNIGGLTINQFSCKWRGNYLVEIGDKLAITTKDGSIVYSYLLNDKSSYNGSFSQVSEWSYEEQEDTSGNPTTLGEALKETFAKVDKANKKIDLVVGKTDANEQAITNLQLDTDSIRATVEETNADVEALTNRVEATMTSEEVKLEIEKSLGEVEKVTTSTGFTFDADGLTVNKNNSEMSTTITEDGMTVYRDSDEMLKANNLGVKAVNLHANTYLIIGTNSRLEDYDGGSRTGCFWIGGGN